MKAVTGAQFCKALHRKGWTYLRTSGSHETWHKAGYGNVTVPVHADKDIKQGLLAKLLRQTGLAQADL